MQIMNKESWLNHQAVNKDTKRNRTDSVYARDSQRIGTSIAKSTKKYDQYRTTWLCTQILREI